MKTFIGQSVKVLSVATIVAGAMLFTASADWAQQNAGDAKQQIVGVWKLASSVNTDKDGKVTNGISFGPNPDGTYLFASSGHYASINVNPSLPKFASGSRMQGTPEENKAVVQGSLALGPFPSVPTAQSSRSSNKAERGLPGMAWRRSDPSRYRATP